MGVMRTYLKRLLASLLIAASGVSTAVATDYYITQTQQGGGGGLTYGASDSVATFNAGAAPYDNLDDDTVYLCDTITTAVVVPDSGTVGHIITIRGDYTGHAGVISGACTDGDKPNCAGLQLYTVSGEVGRTYITVDGVTVTNSNAMGIATKYTGSNITIKNCTVSGSKDGGIVATTAYIDETKTMTSVTIENNVVTNNNTDYATSTGHEAITIENIDGFTVRYNQIYSNHLEGINCKNDAENGNVYGNNVYSNGSTGFPPGIYIDGSHNINIYQNYIHDQSLGQGIGLNIEESSSTRGNDFDVYGIDIYYNLITNNSAQGIQFYTNASADDGDTIDDINIYNNTIYDTSAIYFHESTQPGTTPCNIKNNIIWTGSVVSIADNDGSNAFITTNNPVCNYNLYSTSKATSECTGANDVTTADVLFHTAGSNFHLASTSSPAIDAGDNVSLTTDYDGRTVPYDVIGTANADNGADIGALEWIPYTGYGVGIVGGSLQ